MLHLRSHRGLLPVAAAACLLFLGVVAASAGAPPAAGPPSVASATGSVEIAPHGLFEAHDREVRAIESSIQEVGHTRHLTVDDDGRWVTVASVVAGLLLIGGVGAAWRLGTLDRFRISTKLYAGFGAMVALSGGLVAVQWLSERQIAEQEHALAVASTIAFEAEQMGRIEYEYKHYALADRTKAAHFLSEHEGVAKRILEHQQELAHAHLSPAAHEMAEAMGEKVRHYGTEFAKLVAAYDEVASLKERKTALDVKVEGAIEAAVTKHHAEHHRLRAAHAAPEQVAVQAEAVAALEAIEIAWVKAFSEQNQYLLDRSEAHIRNMEAALARLHVALAEAEPIVRSAAHDEAEANAELAMLATVREGVEGIRSMTAQIVHDEMEVAMDTLRAKADLHEIESLAAAIKDYAHEAVSAQQASAHRAEAVALAVMLALSVMLALAIARSVTVPVAEMNQRLGLIAQGDLTQRANADRRDELGLLAARLNETMAALQQVITDVSGASRDVAAASTQIAASSEEISRGMNEQSQQVQQIASAVEEMSASVTEVAGKSAEAGRRRTAGPWSPAPSRGCRRSTAPSAPAPSVSRPSASAASRSGRSSR